MYSWFGLLSTVGTVVKISAIAARAIKATRIAAALGDFFPVK
jgi:hypothetical protein